VSFGLVSLNLGWLGYLGWVVVRLGYIVFNCFK